MKNKSLDLEESYLIDVNGVWYKWLTNCHKIQGQEYIKNLMIQNRQNKENTYIVNSSKPTTEYTVSRLTDLGMVGVYKLLAEEIKEKE